MNIKELTEMLVKSSEDFHYSKFIPWWVEDYDKFTYRHHIMDKETEQAAIECLAACKKEDLLSSNGKLGLTLFHLLVWHNFYDEVKEMFCDGRLSDTEADITDQKGHGLTPFLLACLRGNMAMARLLLEHGAKDSSCDARGMNAYHFLAYPRLEGLDHDSDALERSVEQRGEIARLLTCDINKKNALGLTPLALLLSTYGSCDAYTWPLAEIFLEKGADTDYVDADGNTLLMMARRNGHETAALQLMKHCPELLDVANNKGVTPVLHAIDYDNNAMYLALIDYGATPVPNEYIKQFSLEEITCRAFGHVYPDNKDSLSIALYMAEKLIRQTDPDDDDEMGEVQSILPSALRSDEKARVLDFCKDAGLDFTMPFYYHGDTSCLRDECIHASRDLFPLRKLMELGVDMNKAVVQGQTPANILASVSHNDPEGERFLQEAAKLLTRESMEATNNAGETAVHLAAENGHVSMLQAMIEKGINVNITEDAPSEAGMTPLHLACLKAKTEVVRLLMAAGADDTMTIRKGSTPAHLVLEEDRWGKSLSTEQMAELLKELKHLDLPNEKGITPLMLLNDSSELLPLLLEKGVDVNHRDNYGRTALMLCVDKDMYKLLLQAGADINMVDNAGNTALHHALQHGSQSAARYLLRKGADYSRPNNKGETPVQLAVEKGYETVLDLMPDIM